jgi:hypothetical protein
MKLYRIKKSAIDKKLMGVIDYFIKDLNDIFTPLEVASALEKITFMNPLPLFYMRTIIQLLKYTTRDIKILHSYVQRWIDELIKRQIWEQNTQWDGFLILIQDFGEKAFPSLVKMPHTGLVNLIGRKEYIRQRLLDV